jgi:hypothetical protein
MNERIRTSWSIGRRDNLSLAMSPLSGVGTPTYIAGFIHNSPDDMAFWIEGPQKDCRATPCRSGFPAEARARYRGLPL